MHVVLVNSSELTSNIPGLFVNGRWYNNTLAGMHVEKNKRWLERKQQNEKLMSQGRLLPVLQINGVTLLGF